MGHAVEPNIELLASAVRKLINLDNPRDDSLAFLARTHGWVEGITEPEVEALAVLDRHLQGR